MTTLSEAYVFHALSRVNPVLPPARRKATALRHAMAIAHVARHVRAYNDIAPLRRWAATIVLDAGSAVALPDGYKPLGDGSLRRRAQDHGGVEAAALRALAETLIPLHGGLPYGGLPYCGPSDRTWLAWFTLYPATAALAGFGYGHTAEEQAEMAIAEWELRLDPLVDGAYWLQIELENVPAVEAGERLAKLFRLPHVTGEPIGQFRLETEDYQFGGWLSDDPNVGSCVQLSLTGSLPVSRPQTEDFLRRLEAEAGCNLVVQVNRHVDFQFAPWHE